VTALTNPQLIPYPESSDNVNIHEDMQALAQRVNDLLTALQIPYLPLNVKNISGFAINQGDPVYITGYIDSKPTVSKSDADDISTFPSIGLMQDNVSNGESGTVVLLGTLENIDTSSYSVGDKLYVASGGGLTTTKPSDGSVVVAVVSSDDINGSLLVGGIKGGNGTWGSLKNGL
jgi:uncharacterized protein (UPF0297 family)